MKIEAITLREIRMKLRTPFEISSGTTSERRVLLVEVLSEGAAGWAEAQCSEGPFFNSETTDSVWAVLRNFLVPMVLGQEVGAATGVAEILSRARGNNMAKAALENAVWDLEAQQKGLPLWKLLGGTIEEISCGVSIGLQPSVEFLLGKVDTELRAGYQRIKLKIKPGKDVAFVKAVRQSYPQIKLSVDANSAYTLDDTGHLKQLDDFYLMMIEQPLAWDDIFEHSKLQAQIQTPICLDESINNLKQAEAAIELKACGIINIKLGRVGGHTAARNIQALCLERSIPNWCGGMLESGVGRAHNIHMSTLPGFVLPGDVSASQRYWKEDIIEPEVEVTPQGTIKVPTTPGLGYAVRRDRVEELTVRREIFTAG